MMSFMMPLVQLVLDDPPAFRDYVSFDWDDIASMIMAMAALVAIFVTKRSKTKAETKAISDVHTINEEVDAGVLDKFTELYERIGALEKSLAKTQVRLETALDEIAEMHKLEEFLQERLHEKEKEIENMKLAHQADIKSKDAELKNMRASLADAQRRISILEAACRRMGMDMDDFYNQNGM